MILSEDFGDGQEQCEENLDREACLLTSSQVASMHVDSSAQGVESQLRLSELLIFAYSWGWWMQLQQYVLSQHH